MYMYVRMHVCEKGRIVVCARPTNEIIVTKTKRKKSAEKETLKRRGIKERSIVDAKQEQAAAPHLHK